MKAYLIDTPNKRVIESEWDGNYRSIATAIQASLYTCVRINEQHDSIFVDDEGLINGNPHGWFEVDDYPQPLRGYGFVLGLDYDTGESVEPRITLEELRARITFKDDSELDEPESYAHSEVIGFDNAEDFFKALGLK